jgi:hypothetical protein
VSETPELDGYIPHEERPLRRRRTVLALRVVVVLALVALVLPGILTTVSYATAGAQAACAEWVAYEAPNAPGSVARFELFGPSGAGWECYTLGAFGGDHHVASLGLIPGAPKIPNPKSVST